MNLFIDSAQRFHLIELLSNFGIRDLVDILIISVFIYTVLIWFWKTTSRFVFIGIIMLGLIYILARQFQLYLTVYLLQGFFAIPYFCITLLRRTIDRCALEYSIAPHSIPLRHITFYCVPHTFIVLRFALMRPTMGYRVTQ